MGGKRWILYFLKREREIKITFEFSSKLKKKEVICFLLLSMAMGNYYFDFRYLGFVFISILSRTPLARIRKHDDACYPRKFSKEKINPPSLTLLFVLCFVFFFNNTNVKHGWVSNSLFFFKCGIGVFFFWKKQNK